MSNFGFDPLWPWLGSRPPLEDLPGFRVRPVDVAPVSVPGLHSWQPPATGSARVAPGDTQPDTETASPPWWEHPTGPSVLGGESQSHWPWLRAQTDEVPGFRLKSDSSGRTDEPGGDVRLMAGAFAPVDVAPVGVPGLHDWQPPTTGAARLAPNETLLGTETAAPPVVGAPSRT